MATTRELITGSLRLLNVIATGEAPSEDDVNITKSALNGMIDSWSNNKLMIYTMNPYVFNLVAGQQIYTLGNDVTADWQTFRPLDIENAYVRLNANTQQQLDIKLKILTDDQYADISAKNTPSTFPFAIFDNGNYPLRSIYVFPTPTQNSQIVLWLRQPLIDLTDIDAEVSYPPGYERAFRFNLAVEVAPEFGRDAPERVVNIATAAKLEIERTNSSPVYLKGDGGNTPRGRTGGTPSSILTGGFFNLGR